MQTKNRKEIGRDIAMTPEALTMFLQQNIPLVKSMDIQVTTCNKEQICLFAPLSPNRNHKQTAFGGSIAAIATVCGWSYMFLQFQHIFPNSSIVIQKSNIQYIAPIRDDFIVECIYHDTAKVQSVIQCCQQHGKGKMTLEIHCYCQNKLCATLEGTFFVVL